MHVLLSNKKWSVSIAVFLFCAGLLYAFFPSKPDLYRHVYFSKTAYDRYGDLLAVTLAKDDVYRVFTPLAEINQDLVKAVLLYEDKYFYYHFGFNPFAIMRSAWMTMVGNRRMGASTLTMQLARSVYRINSSNFIGKIKQIFYAMIIEGYYSKDEILEAYLNVVPYGHNIEGVGAAALIYFHTRAKNIILPQALMLAVIPQNPVIRTPDTKTGLEAVIKARDNLAKKWKQTENKNVTDIFLPLNIYKITQIPFFAPHFTRRIFKENNYKNIRTSLDLLLQQKIVKILNDYIQKNKKFGLKNGAILLKNYRTGETLVYIGSASFFNSEILGQVDGVDALRSPGSVLKPFIYALAMDYGIIHPMSLLKDIPRQYGIYSPENFDRKYQGALSATDALNLSRNVPAVDLLLRVPDNAFYQMLEKAGIRHLKSPEFYGLALALGGAEITLENAVDLYAMIGNLGVYKNKERMLSPESAFLIKDMLNKNPFNRVMPNYIKKDEDQQIAWKTGTSYSYKDAWTVGIFGDYVLGVWIGNFDGTPNPVFVGRSIAAPLFFKVTDFIKKNYEHYTDSEEMPQDLNIRKVDICEGTFDIAGKYCPKSFKSWIIPLKSPIKVSGIHRLIPVYLDGSGRACHFEKGKTILEVFEVWPSDLAAAFKRAGIHKNYPPPFAEECSVADIITEGKNPEIVYPADGLEYAVTDTDASNIRIPLKATVDNDASKIFWFVNDTFVGESEKNDVFVWNGEIGSHSLTAVDDLGRSRTVKITVSQAK